MKRGEIESEVKSLEAGEIAYLLGGYARAHASARGAHPRARASGVALWRTHSGGLPASPQNGIVGAHAVRFACNEKRADNVA